MSTIKIKPRKPYHLSRIQLNTQDIDIGGRDILIGFNETAPKLGKGGENIYSILNARFITYFLPAIDIAIKQKKRPQFYIVSGINAAMKWNARSQKEQLKMLAHNKIKFDFLKRFLETYFPNTFSIIEYIVSQDPLRISEEKLVQIWMIIEEVHPKKAAELKKVFAKFNQPHKDSPELMNAIKYAVSHLFAFGDINFEGNYYINPKGFASIGGYQEKYFNDVRNLAFEGLKKRASKIFDQPIITRNNVQIIIEKEEKTPPPYAGSTKGNSKRRTVDEVTYENNRTLEYYDTRPKLKPDMEYLYSRISRKKYEKFWNMYKKRYVDLKARYEEAYQIRL